MGTHYSRPLFLLFLSLSLGCTPSLIKTNPQNFTDTSEVTITCNANKGNKALLNFSGPVYVHLGLITDSSTHPNDWRYVKFKWGSTDDAALAKQESKNSWSYHIPNIRTFFEVSRNENILQLAVLFRSGACIDTFCKVLRNADKTDMYIPIIK